MIRQNNSQIPKSTQEPFPPDELSYSNIMLSLAKQ
uniref:Uncharacterized protein n=1 Tax=Rhizophora mucronata TaxID=61149 RepID=A0A2P2P0F6_RHIMU